MRSTPGQSGEQCPGVSSRWLPVLDGRQTISVVAAAVGSGRDGDVEVQVEVDSANVDHHAAIADVQGRRLRVRRLRFRRRDRLAAQRLHLIRDVAGLQRVLQVLLSRQGRQTLHVVVHPENTRVVRLAAAARLRVRL